MLIPKEMKKNFCSLPYVILISLIVLTFQNAPLRAEIYIDNIVFKKVNSPQQLASFLEGVYQKSLDSGITNFIPYSLLLIKEAQKALKEKDYEKAETLSEYAQKLSPDLPPVYITKARVQWSKNRILIHQPIKGYVKAFLKKTQDIEDLSFILFSNLSIIAGAFLITLFVFTSISMIKYFRLAFHDFRHAVTNAVPNTALWGMVSIVFLLPIFFNFTFFWVCFYWLILLFSYHRKKERFAIIGILLLFALMPLVIAATCFSLYMPQSDVIKLLWKANYGYWDQRDIENLENYNRKYPDDQDILFSLGLVHKKDNYYRTSQRYYKKLIDINPYHYKAHINIGNVYLATERWQEAVEHYKEAISIAPSLSSAAHFNFARAYEQKFMFKEAEKELLEAKKIDTSRIDSYLKIYSENYNRLLIDETISRENLWKKGYLFFGENRELTNGVWNLLFTGIPLPYATAVILCISFVGLILSRKDRFRIAVKCKTCGRAICGRCQRNILEDAMCYQCLNLLKKKEKMDYRLKEEKISGIKRNLKTHKYIGTVLSLFFPGSCHVWKGQPIKGTICLFLFFILLLKAISVMALEGPWEFIGSSRIPEVITLLIFLVLFWFLLVIDAFKLKSKDVDDRLLSA